MYFDFCDVGTSDFDTSLDIKKLEQKILLVEPIFSYLKNLPDGENIYKANFAISNKNGWNDMFYIKEDIIKKYNFPDWIKGCNSLGKKHVTVIRLLKERGLTEDLISVEKVRVLSFENLIYLYDIDQINFLKIDTEGNDHLILRSVLDCLRKEKIKIKKIKFEYDDSFKNTKQLQDIIGSLSFYYKKIYIEGNNNVIVEYIRT